MKQSEIASFLFYRRSNIGMSCKEVARQAGTTDATVSRYERGKRADMKLGVVIRILDALGYELTIRKKV